MKKPDFLSPAPFTSKFMEIIDLSQLYRSQPEAF